MPASVEDQLRSAESALSFLRSEHSRTLAGLHEEIERLQTRCKELTFSLTLQSSQSQTRAKEHDSLHHGTKKSWRKELFDPESVLSHPAFTMTARDSSISRGAPDSARTAVGQERDQLQSMIEEKEKKIYYLERELRLREDSYLAELARKNRQVALLTRRLHSRPAAIVQISPRVVRKTKTRKASDDANNHPVGEESVPGQETVGVNGCGDNQSGLQKKPSQTKLPSLSTSLPSFPPQDRTLSAVARRGKAGSAHVGSRANGKPTPATKPDVDHSSRQSSAKTTRSQRVSASSTASRKPPQQGGGKAPEPSPFIVDIPTELFLQIRPAPAILPPIAGRGRHAWRTRHRRSVQAKHREAETERPRKPPPPAMESIAVDTVASPGAELMTPVEQSRTDCS
ncbi:PREDICTED: coiled-coil domain-containing protein 92-like [Branchiostoma belcheri]|uniref:Coiled-coil domain-containing protein 92-like n=1 Tax=Branchiostoma belcheri TaxID=7741 RepID=A0A6P4YBW3_BRABE|nr:PREDICTED: coiled-coil domain-containing protein 92-like [Branchiostoma belcheri]